MLTYQSTPDYYRNYIEHKKEHKYISKKISKSGKVYYVYDKPIKVEKKLNATDKGAPRSHGKDSGSYRQNFVNGLLKNMRMQKAKKKGFVYIHPLTKVRKTNTRSTLFTRKRKDGLPLKY